ncbi:MAG: FAD-dependent oxidoreductase [Marmoricola sp.]
MPYVVTQSCCSDASCVLACPVNCIHPAPGEPGFAESEMVYIDADTCVDCGACTTACPVDAIKPHTQLTEGELPFIALASSYYQEFPHADRTPLALVPMVDRPRRDEEIRVAIVGAGPAGMYAADELLKYPDVVVDVIDRLPTPYGLVRAGVAPDHQRTKKAARLFGMIEREPGFGYLLNLRVGEHVTHDDLVAHYHGVIYASGAASDRSMGIDGEDLVGSWSATAVVGWYNGHPDYRDLEVDLSSERVVIVGNGNVAFDVARILTADAERLAATDIADHALAALRASAVREVLVLGRRGVDAAAFTLPELIGLMSLPDVDLIVEGDLSGDGEVQSLLREVATRPTDPARRRIVLRFNTAPVQVLGESRVSGIEVARTVVTDGGVVLTDDREKIETGSVLRSVGYQAVPVPDLPFDEETSTVPHTGGRVTPGTYVTGWIKRGPRGFIGTNKSDSEETVQSLLDDLGAGRLASPSGTREDFQRLARSRQPDLIDSRGWAAIDAHERAAGGDARPRRKFTSTEEMVAVAKPAQVERAGVNGARRRRWNLLG